jgi:hypothetical protein
VRFPFLPSAFVTGRGRPSLQHGTSLQHALPEPTTIASSAPARSPTRRAVLFQPLAQLALDHVERLDADGQPHQPLGDPQPQLLRRAGVAVRGRPRVMVALVPCWRERGVRFPFLPSGFARHSHRHDRQAGAPLAGLRACHVVGFGGGDAEENLSGLDRQEGKADMALDHEFFANRQLIVLHG